MLWRCSSVLLPVAVAPPGSSSSSRYIHLRCQASEDPRPRASALGRKWSKTHTPSASGGVRPSWFQAHKPPAKAKADGPSLWCAYYFFDRGHSVGGPTSIHSSNRNARLLRNRARSDGAVKGGSVEKAAAKIDAIDLAAIVHRRQSGGHVYVRQLGSPRSLLRSHCKWTTVRRGAARKQLQRTDAKAEEQ